MYYERLTSKDNEISREREHFIRIRASLHRGIQAITVLIGIGVGAAAAMELYSLVLYFN